MNDDKGTQQTWIWFRFIKHGQYFARIVITVVIALIIRCSNCWYRWSLLSAEKAFIYGIRGGYMIINWLYTIYIYNTGQVEIYTQNSEAPYIYIEYTYIQTHLFIYRPADLPTYLTSLPPHLPTHIRYDSGPPWVVKAWKLWFQGCICRQRQDLGMGQWSTGGWVHAHAAAANAENICLLKSACYQTGTTVLQQK